MIKEWLPDILKAVYKASDEIMKVYDDAFEVVLKADNSPVTEADQRSNDILFAALQATGVLTISEEESIPDYKDRENKDVWLLDPLDGTKEFVKKSGEFCICIALIKDGKSVFGLIASPINEQVIIGGVDVDPVIMPYRNLDFENPEYAVKEINQEIFECIIYSRTQITPKIDEFIKKQSAKYGHIKRIKKGSAIKFFDLMSGKANVYLRLWPTMEWDIAAGHAIFNSVGGEILDFTTFTPLTYNKRDLENPHFIAKPRGLDLI